MSRPAPVRLGLSLGPDVRDPLGRAEAWGRAVEEIGVDLVGTCENPVNCVDPYLLLARLAPTMSRPLLGPVVTAPEIRHPAATARALHTLHVLSGGRAFLGVGTGRTSLPSLGLPVQRLDRTLAFARAVKLLCAGEEVEWDGERVRLRVEPVDLPVLLAAEGPRTLAAAGEVADGVLVGNSASPQVVAEAEARVRAGAERSGRDPGSVVVWHIVRAHVAADEDAAVADLAFYVARYVGTGFDDDLRLRGRPVEVDEDTAGRLRALRAEYSPARAASEPGYSLDLLDRHELRRWAGRLFLVAGDVDQVAARLAELVEAGASHILVSQLLPDLETTTRQVGEVFARLR